MTKLSNLFFLLFSTLFLLLLPSEHLQKAAVAQTSPAPTAIPLPAPCKTYQLKDDPKTRITGEQYKKAIRFDCSVGCISKDMEYRCVEVETAIGTISTQPTGFVTAVYALLLSLAGGIALALIIFAGYQLMVSQGDPEKINAAKETLTSAIVGLLFLIFSMVILEIIGVDILRLPGFGR